MAAPGWAPRVAALAAVLCCLLAGGATRVGAQQATAGDSLFRRGQWGVQFTPDELGAGVLRFSSPRRAWVLDASVQHQQQTLENGGTDTKSRLWGGQLRLGSRGYRPLSRGTLSFGELGLRGDYMGTSNSGRTSRMWSAGAYAALGVAYRVTPRFGVGATSGVELTYGRWRAEDPPATSTSSAVSLATRGAQLQVTAYF